MIRLLVQQNTVHLGSSFGSCGNEGIPRCTTAVGSKLQLTAVGMFLIDPDGSDMWSALARVSSAALLKTSNLVIYDFRSTILWKSFDSPTDTILPTQRFTIGFPSLVAPISETNYSIAGGSRFLCSAMEIWFSTPSNHHQIQLSITYLLMMQPELSTLIFSLCLISLVQFGSTDVVVVLQDNTDPALDYQRAILEYDGVFRKYVYPRSSSPSNRVKWMLKAIRPQGICSIVSSGTGVCGLNNICHIQNEQLQRPLTFDVGWFISLF